MRAGTHYMCAALRVTQEAALMRPKGGIAFGPMPDSEILDGMHPESRVELPHPRPGRHVFFSHYYHDHYRHLPPMRRISLIAYPLDSFYSDGVVFSDEIYSPAPSEPRAQRSKYKFRYGSPEWRKLEPWMEKNARWLMEIGQSEDDLVVRYEDLCDRFEETAGNIEWHLGTFLNPMPRPVSNRLRAYWTRDFASKFDADALDALNDIFREGIRRFYPECIPSSKV
jgi:hypothetical protein